MATVKDAKLVTPKEESPVKVFFNFAFFYLFFFICLVLIASFGIIAEF